MPQGPRRKQTSEARNTLGAVGYGRHWGAQAKSEEDPQCSVSAFCSPRETPDRQVVPGVHCTPTLWLHLLHSLCEPGVIVQSLMSSVATSYDLFPDIVDIWMFVSEISQFLNFIN